MDVASSLGFSTSNPAYIPEQAVEDGPRVWTPYVGDPDRLWPLPHPSSHLGSEPALPLSLSFGFVTLPPKKVNISFIKDKNVERHEDTVSAGLP